MPRRAGASTPRPAPAAPDCACVKPTAPRPRAAAGLCVAACCVGAPCARLARRFVAYRPAPAAAHSGHMSGFPPPPSPPAGGAGGPPDRRAPLLRTSLPPDGAGVRGARPLTLPPPSLSMLPEGLSWLPLCLLSAILLCACCGACFVQALEARRRCAAPARAAASLGRPPAGVGHKSSTDAQVGPAASPPPPTGPVQPPACRPAAAAAGHAGSNGPAGGGAAGGVQCR